MHSFISKILVLLLVTSSPILQANLPELSSINPIEFDEASQKLVAKGDALFELDDLKIKANSIIYYRNYSLLDATGNISLASQNHRLLADSFLYNAEAERFSFNNVKYGYWPYYFLAENGGGSLNAINLNTVDLFIGEPKKFSPNFRAKSLSITNEGNDHNVTLNHIRFRIGSVPVFYIPKLKYSLNDDAFSLSANVGNSGEFGTYLESDTIFHVNKSLKAGANINLYSERGVLWGPTLQYNYKSSKFSAQGAFDSGFIKDDGELGIDYMGNLIEKERSYAILKHKQKHKNQLTITTQLINNSDSEVLRDFNEFLHERNFNPLNFFEAVLPKGNFIFSLFSHFNIDDFSRVRERLPEILITYLPSNIWNSSIFHSGSIAYSKINESADETDFSSIIESLDYSVFDMKYRISKTFSNQSFNITPELSYRGFQFNNGSELDDLNFLDRSYHYVQYGIKLGSQYQARYKTENSLWNIKGLRHIFSPEISVQKIRLMEGTPNDAQFYRNYSISEPLTDLSSLRDYESINELFLTRLSLMNFFQTKANDYAARNLMELHFIADFYHEIIPSAHSPFELHKNALWIDYHLSPAPWIKLQLSSRLKSEDFSISENRIRLILRSADRWELSLNSYYVKSLIDQLSLNYYYKLNENSKLNTLLYGDIKEKEITRFRIGLEKLSSSNWKTSYYLNYRKDLRKSDDLSFNIGLQLLSF